MAKHNDIICQCYVVFFIIVHQSSLKSTLLEQIPAAPSVMTAAEEYRQRSCEDNGGCQTWWDEGCEAQTTIEQREWADRQRMKRQSANEKMSVGGIGSSGE